MRTEVSATDGRVENRNAWNTDHIVNPEPHTWTIYLWPSCYISKVFGGEKYYWKEHIQNTFLLR